MNLPVLLESKQTLTIILASGDFFNRSENAPQNTDAYGVCLSD
ncbi:hypothetical protein [Mixta gaviniae]|nr:hypothetical protein [Mixta gaviniae]